MSGEQPIFIKDLQIGTVLVTDLEAISLNVTGTANATSTTTGSLRTAGGLGVVKDVWIGGSLFMPTGSATLSAGTLSAATLSAVTVLATGVANATSAITGSLRTAGGLAVALNAWVAGSVRAVAGVITGSIGTDAASTLSLMTNNIVRLIIPATGITTDYTTVTSLMLSGATMVTRDDGLYITSSVTGIPAGTIGTTASFLTLNGSNVLQTRNDIDVEASFGYTWTTGFTVAQSSTISYVKVGSFVSLTIGAVSGTRPPAVVGAISTSAGAIPVGLRPATDFIWYVPQSVAGVFALGEIVIGTNGSIVWYSSDGAAGFPPLVTVFMNGPWLVSYNML